MFCFWYVNMSIIRYTIYILYVCLHDIIWHKNVLMEYSYWWWTPDLVSSLSKFFFIFKQGLLNRLLDTSAISAAFDTIDHDNLFCILEKYVGTCGNALKLIKSYFSNRTQRVQIDDALSDFANIIYGVPQESVLGPLKLCLYLLPMSAILK